MQKILGINLPVAPWGFYSAEEVVKHHVDKLNESGKVWFSTSNRIDPKKAGVIKYILFTNKSGLRYIATVVDYKFFEEKGLPSSSEEFSPEYYSTEEEKHWFLIDSIEKISSDDVNKLIMLNREVQNQYGSVEGYINNTKRLQVFYFEK